MGILLKILAIAGKTAGILLLIILILLLLLLLVPIRYRGEIHRRSGGYPGAAFCISWLLHFLQAEGGIEKENSLQVRIKLLGFTIKRLGGEASGREKPSEPPDRSSGGRSAEESANEESEGTDVPLLDEMEGQEDTEDTGYVQPGTPRSGSIADGRSDERDTEHAKQSGKKTFGRKRPKRTAFTLPDPFTLLYRIEDAADTIGEKAEKAGRQVRYWDTGTHRAAVRYILKRLGILWEHYKPRRMKGFLRYGTGMPDKTGYLTGILSLALPAAAAEYELQPDFLETCLETDTTLQGHIRAVHLAGLAAAVLLKKDCRILMRNALRARKGGKHG